jgi:hypothetical protein
LIIKLGAELADKVSIDVYQLARQTNSWEWSTSNITNAFDFEVIQNATGNKSSVGLIISLTNDIANEVISQSEIENFYVIKAKANNVNSIQSIEDLNTFWLTYQKVCDDIINGYGSDVVIHLFPCAPVSAVFEIGRRRMPNVYPTMVIYDNNDGRWSSAITIKK